MSAINDTKQKIYDKLATLVVWPLTTKTQLGSLYQADIKRDPLDMDIQKYPAAFIMPPAIRTSVWLDNRTVERELLFTIMVLQKMDNINSTSEIEDLMQTMIDVIDNSITFDNVARAGVFPTTSFPEPLIHNGRSLVVFDIMITAKVLQTLTYT